VFPEALVMMDAVTAEQVISVPLRDFESRFGAPYALIHRADLLDALLETCRNSPLIRLETSRQVNDFHDNGHTVHLRTQDGQDYDTPALIGADGLWSTIRQRILGDGKPHVAGNITYPPVFPAAEMSSCPLSPARGRIVQSRRSVPQQPLRGRLEFLRRPCRIARALSAHLR
jgi:salicylate hydroxylase